MRQYKVEVIITEGCDEFWDGLENLNKSGVDDIEQCMFDAVYNAGFPEAKVRVVEYTNK